MPDGLDLRALLYERERRIERRECEGSLLQFFQRCWKEVDPSPFVLNWHHIVICRQLERLARGEIRDLIINIPPRCGKSILVSVAFPAWLWVQKRDPNYPLIGPQCRFLCVSYGSTLAEVAAVKMRRLVMGPWFQGQWGDRVKILADQASRGDFGNTAGGERISNSIEGGILGRGGDIQICFPYDEIIWTEHGPRKIGEIVERREHCRVWSFNHTTRAFELQSLTGWHINPGRPMVQINGGTRCTVDHRVLTELGYVEAGRLAVGDLIVNFPAVCSPLRVDDQIEMPPSAPGADVFDSAHAHAISLGEDAGDFLTCGDISNLSLGKAARAVAESAVVLAVLDVLCPRAVGQSLKRWLRAVAEDVANLLSLGAWAEKGERDHAMDLAIVGFPIASEGDARIAIDVGCRHHLGRNPKVALPVAESGKTADSAQVRDFVIGEVRDRQPAFLLVDSVIHLADIPLRTFCVSVDYNRNMVVSQDCIVASNCDDPHKVDGAESDVERERTIRAMREGLTTRVTDPRISARVLVMQRLHSDDATNYALENWPAPVHVMLPMRFEPERYVDFDIRDSEGELLWPEVWDEESVAREERELGSYGASGQLQQIPISRGGGIVSDKLWMLWDDEEFPEFGTCVASLDTAYKVTESADYNALTVWCAFEHPESRTPKLMLRAAWKMRASLGQLVARVIATCREHKVDMLLIEDSARGPDVMDEIYRLVSRREISVILVRAATDKASRLHATVPVFENGIIYAPDKEWAQEVIDEVSKFPRGKYDDFCFVGGTSIATRRGPIAIEHVKLTDMILTPLGWRGVVGQSADIAPVIESNGLTGTGGHPIFTVDAGFRRLDTLSHGQTNLVRLRLCDLIRLTLPKPWNLWASSTVAWEGSENTTYLSQPRTPDGATLKGCMWPYGSMPISVRCRLSMRCITETTIRLISMMTIWSAYRKACIAVCLNTWTWKNNRHTWRKFVLWQLRGIVARRGGRGIESMFSRVWRQLGLWPRNLSRERLTASGAVSFVSSRIAANGFVDRGAMRTIWTGAQERCASSLSILRRRMGLIPIWSASGAAINSAMEGRGDFAETNAEPRALGTDTVHPPLSIPIMRPIFNLEVDGACGYFANGILVHNCDSVSMAITYLRKTGVATRKEEYDEDILIKRRFKKQVGALYDV